MHFMQENAFENVICEMAAILPWSKYFTWNIYSNTVDWIYVKYMHIYTFTIPILLGRRETIWTNHAMHLYPAIERIQYMGAF